MRNKFKKKLLGLTWDALDRWADPRSVARGKGYQTRVEDVVEMPDGGIVARVHGRDDYLTKIVLKPNGALEAECTCPVGYRCKHAVALVLVAARQLKDGKGIEPCNPNDAYFDEIVDAFKTDESELAVVHDIVSEYLSQLKGDEIKNLMHELVAKVSGVRPYIMHKVEVMRASTADFVRMAKQAIKSATAGYYDRWDRRGGHDKVPDYGTVEEYFGKLKEAGDWKSVEALSGEYEMLLKNYMVVGGMPEPVNCWVETSSLAEARRIQRRMLLDYDDDFKKHAPIDLLPKIRLLWNNIPAQLAKENRKFIYTALKSGARAREYEAALGWLDDAGMIHQVFRAAPPRLPLTSYQDFSAFKLYMHDVGLLGAMSGTAPSMLLDGNALFTNFKGALTEQYVLQELLVAGYKPAYWTNDAGNAEVEFVVQGEKAVCPVEAKAGINTQAKSLKVYQKLFSPPFAIRTSLAGANDGSWIKDIPLYAFGPSIRQCCRVPL